MQFTTACYFECIGIVGSGYFQSNVCFHFFKQTSGQFTRCYRVTVFACEWRVVYHETHFQSWFFDFQEFHWIYISRIADGFPNVDFTQTRYSYNFPYGSRFNFVFFQALETKQFANTCLFYFAFTSLHCYHLTIFDSPAVYSTYCDTTQKVIVIHQSNLCLQWAFYIAFWRRNMFNDSIVQRF